jgi:hypothetical protein
MSNDFEQQEYFALVKAVDDFDQRLITIKGWGVTLSLVALGLGFQYSAYGFFLVAAASSLAFWLIEGTVKRHQMRHYPRMREIELNRYVAEGASAKATSSPRIDWSWQRAAAILSGKVTAGSQVAVSPSAPSLFYRLSWVLPHVALPHVITFAIGIVLFLLGSNHHLAGFSLGSHAK